LLGTLFAISSQSRQAQHRVHPHHWVDIVQQRLDYFDRVTLTEAFDVYRFGRLCREALHESQLTFGVGVEYLMFVYYNNILL
jgi:hypothetical protein